MIDGRVENLQALVEVEICVSGADRETMEFVVDTGFEGALALPRKDVARLNLPFFDESRATLANDESVRADVHLARIIWAGKEVDVVVYVMGNRPLLGTALLSGKVMTAQFVDDGRVEIADL